MVHRLTARSWLEIGRGRSHGGAQCFSFAHDHDSAVIADVWPFVSVGGPRIGLIKSACQVAKFWRGVGPEAKCAVHVNPGASFFRAYADLFGGIERAGIHVACLDADDRARANFRKLVRAHPALAIRFDDGYALFPEARETQRLQD